MGRPNEDSFILEFIKTYYGNGNLTRLKHLWSISDMSRLTDRLNELQVISFFFAAISSAVVLLEIPPETLKEWQMLTQKIALRNMLIESEGSKILKRLSEQGVRCTLLKGFSHMEKLYGNTWVRPVSDLDILISQNDFPFVKDYLLTDGFTIFQSDTTRKWDQVNGKLFTEQHFFKNFGVCTLNLDFHWDGVPASIEPQYDLECYSWTENTERVRFGDIEVDCLNSEMQMIHCVDHLALHHSFYNGLKWFLDLCQFVVKLGGQLDWTFIRSVVTKPNSRKAFGITLRLIHEVVGDAGPAAGNWRDFWPGRGLPGEYFLYRQQLLSGHPKTFSCLYQLLLPVKIKDKFKILSVLLFNGNTFSFLGRQRPFLRPLYILYKGVEELLLPGMQKRKRTQS